MSKGLRRLLAATLVLVIAGGPAYWLLVRHSPVPTATFPLDLARIRALALSVPGERPAEVRFERVLSIHWVEALQLAGDPWRAIPMDVYAYQLVYPAQTVLIDTAQDRASVQPQLVLRDYDDAAYARVSAALERAALIVATHEHLDHVGGAIAHPRLARLLPALRLTAEQFDNPRGPPVGHLPDDVASRYQPLRYDGLHALAPGVVLVKAPGHTSGSQMVYVQRADGRELLFLGDVSWRLRNVEQVRERPLLTTALIGEDRHAVLAQFQALHELAAREPALALVPGHDAPAIRRLQDAGLLLPGFKVT
jgi:glyoxylase-like metal-dependent hydrolase (beta-lactamase superfamily II)